MDSRVVQFSVVNDHWFLKLKLFTTVVKYRLDLDLMTGLDVGIVTLEYPLSKTEYKLYLRYFEIITSVIIQYGLHLRPESKYHSSNILYYAIQCNRRHSELIKEKESNARVNNMIDFIRVAKRLTPLEKQNVHVSLLIKNQPFEFQDQPILFEKVVNKLLGTTIETIRNGYPDLWSEYIEKDNTPVIRPSKAESALRNIAVAEIAGLIVTYLNEHSTKLKKDNGNVARTIMTSAQGNFIYDLLTELKIYKPTKRRRVETNAKDKSYHSLRKLVERHRRRS